MRYLTYGATGVQGAPVARLLAERRHQVRALVRDPKSAEGLAEAGIEVLGGDMGDADSVRAASARVDGVFFHLPLVFDRAQGLAYARNVIDAAKAAGVEVLVVNTGSIVPARDTGYLHLDLKRAIEAYCAEVSLPTIVLRPRAYYEVLAAPWVREGLLTRDTLAFPMWPDYRTSWSAVADVAALAAGALERPDLAGSVLEVGGPAALTGPELAEASRASGDARSTTTPFPWGTSRRASS